MKSPASSASRRRAAARARNPVSSAPSPPAGRASARQPEPADDDSWLSKVIARPNFHSLSVRDLMDARDAYHYHLINKKNVVGTAIGLYLIRDTEKESPADLAAKAGGHPADAAAHRHGKPERRLDNSSVRSYSWPCVLVMVKKWINEGDFGLGRGKVHPTEMVPKTLYLPDGRMVPVCVVKVTPAEARPQGLPRWQWPDSLLGGGFPVEVAVQGQTRLATLGCLATDGHTTYALTSRHVCGPAGTPVYARLRGERVRIGRSAGREVTRLPFAEVYSKLKLTDSYSNLDVGLIEVDDLTQWTSQIYGLGVMGPLADLNEHNLSLRLIGQKVTAQGAASGTLSGEIKAMFYRYMSLNGFEYIADYLIGPADQMALQTQPGDSGAIWHLTPPAGHLMRPFGIEWGGIAFEGSGGRNYQFALATSLGNACRILDVGLVHDHNTGFRPFWGMFGHYSIAAFAAQLLSPNSKVGKLMRKNVDRISFGEAALTPEGIKAGLGDPKEKDPDFIPLADVPDLIWKKLPSQKKGGRDTNSIGKGRSTGPEHPTHFADIDEENANGETLRALSLRDPANNLTPAFWGAFYDANGHTSNKPTERGLLPFRVWQFYDAMVAAAQARDAGAFVCAAGLLSHYVGDACQPLHGSIYADGYKDQPVQIEHTHREDGSVYYEDSHVGAGVHSAYETAMVDRKSAELVNLINAALPDTAALPDITSGAEAALATVALMDRSATAIPPQDIVETYLAAGGKPNKAEQEALWDAYGDATAQVMLDGANVLATLWRSAWLQGNGNDTPNNKIVHISPAKLKALYTDPGFVPSLVLDDIAAVLQ